MITLWIADNVEKIKETLLDMLTKEGNTCLNIVKEENIIKILKKDDIKSMVSLEDKLIELEEALYREKKGVLYKSILEIIERPLLEHILERTEGNQLKAARILGMNRNTIRAKIKKLGINTQMYKQ